MNTRTGEVRDWSLITDTEKATGEWVENDANEWLLDRRAEFDWKAWSVGVRIDVCGTAFGISVGLGPLYLILGYRRKWIR